MKGIEQLKKENISKSVSDGAIIKDAQGEVIKAQDPELSKEVINDIIKGVYASNYQNKKKGRVGQQYGGRKQEDPKGRTAGKIGSDSKDFSKPKSDKPTVEDYIAKQGFDKMTPAALKRHMDHHKNLAELTGDAGHAQVFSHLSELHANHYAHQEGDKKEKKDLAARKGNETKAANQKAAEKKKKESAQKRELKKQVKAHSNYSEEDYKHLSKKGYSDKEILGIWGEDKKAGKGPIKGNPKPQGKGIAESIAKDAKKRETHAETQAKFDKEKEKKATKDQKEKASSKPGEYSKKEKQKYIKQFEKNLNDSMKDGYLEDQDHEDLKYILDHLKAGGDPKEVRSVVQNLDTIVRDEIPPELHEIIGSGTKIKKALGILGIVEDYEDDPDRNLEKGMKQYSGKDAPVGWVNKYGKQKIAPKGPNNWKYVGKQHAGQILSLTGVPEGTPEPEIPGSVMEVSKNTPTHIDPDDVQTILHAEDTPAKTKLKELIDIGVHDPSKLESLTKVSYADIVAYMDKRKIKKVVDDLDLTQFNNLPEVPVEERWATYKVMLNMVAHGLGKSLIAYGTGGVGKTWNMKKEFAKAELKEFKEGDSPGVSDYDYIKVTGYQTPKALYKNLYEHNGKIIVFDDCDKALLDETAVNLLKGALDTTGDGTIEYGSSHQAKGSDGELIPQRFDFKGRIAFVSNLPSHKMPQPLRSRAFTVDLTMNAHETVEMLKGIADVMEFQNSEGEPIFVSTEDRHAAINFVDKYKDAIDIGDLNARTLGQIALIKKQIEAMGAEQMKLMKITNWENVAITMLK